MHILWVAPDYAADLSVPILDLGQNAKEKESSPRPCVNLIIIIDYTKLLLLSKKVHL